jgi:hypothetical protein
MTESTSFIQPREVDMERQAIQDELILYSRRFTSRLLLGTARYDSPSLLADAIGVADPALLTVSLRRQLSASKESGESIRNVLFTASILKYGFAPRFDLGTAAKGHR